MEVALNYLTEFVNKCAGCLLGRRGECPWMEQYRAAAQTFPFQGGETFENRVITLSGIISEDSCEMQHSFDVYVSRTDMLLAGAEIPVTYDGLRTFFSRLRQLSLRRKRFPKPLLPLLGDLTGVGCEHCLAQIDYTYLTWGFDIETILVDAFPSYCRAEVFENCNYPFPFVSQAIKHAKRLDVEEMEILGTLLPQHREDLGIGIPVSYLLGKSEAQGGNNTVLPDDLFQFVLPYLHVLIENKYCDETFRWISTKQKDGHAYTQAAWIVQVLSRQNTKLVQYKLGELLGIRHISIYSGRVPEDAPYKEPIRRMFRGASLPFD